ncbi:MAG: Cna B-type domain-containing protein [Clostridia bacterium]|nr:Cna B-type domain-containing protein [Clostridia bacterium]
MFRSVKRPMFLLLFLLALFIAVNGAFSLSVGYAEGASQNGQIVSAKIEWVTPDSPSDGQANRLFIRKHSDDSEISMQFQINAVLTGQEPHEPGSVRILFPRQIWHERSTYYADGAVMSAGCGGMTFSVPDAPSENSLWHWEEAENGQYAIVNDAAIDAAAQINFECTITGVVVSKIVDMRPSDPLKATVEVTTRSGVKDTMSTQELTAVIDTRERLSDPGAGMSAQVYSTPESVPAGAKENLPGGPETANKYVFVRWKTWPLYEGTQYFSLDMDVWAGVAEGNGVSIPGIILGEVNVSDGTVGTETSGEQAGEHYSRQTVRYNYDGRGWNDYRAREIWAAYPTDQMQNNKTYTIRAASQWTLTEADPEQAGDPREVSRAGATASANYLHAGWEYPAGTFGVYKYSGSQPSHTHNTPVKDRPDGSTSSQSHKKDKTYEMTVGALRNGKSVTLDFEVLTVGYGYSYTAGPTSEVPDLPEGWEEDPSHYLNWTYRMETTDDTVSVANISNGGNLGAGDYYFDSITIAAPEMFSYGRQTSDTYQIPGSEFGYRPDNRLPKPDVEVWIEKNKSGSWELYQTVAVRSGTKKITFPADANVTGYRTVVATNQAACKLAVWPKVTILPSAHVMELAEERLQGYTNVVLKNEARQVTTFYQSAERQDEVLPEQTAWLEANDDYTTESSDSSLSTLTEAGYKVYGSMPSTGDYTYTRTSNDPVNRRVVVTLFAAVYEQANVTDGTKYNEAVAMGAITPETSGTWYLLLPEHFVPNTSTIQMRSGDRVTDVKVTENFRNSGRTLVTVKATLTPDPKKLSSYNSQANNCWGDKIQISMDMYVPWSDYNKVRNGYAVYHAAFESGNPGRLGNLTDQNYYQTVGCPDVWPGTPNTYLYSISDSQIRGWMSDLDPDSDEERFVYLRVSESIRDADLSEQVEFRKDARADQGDSWGRGTRDENQVTVTEGGRYTYRLTVASKQDAKTKGILIYDALEEYVPHEGYDQDDVNGKKAWSGAWQGKGQWKGTLESVDLSELYGDRCMGRLYYSTTSGLVFDNNIDTNVRGWVNFDSGAWGSAYRLTDTDIWTEVTGSLENGVWTVPDALKGKVTAIAVNAERYNQADIAASYDLDPGEKLSVYLNMAAPTDNGNDGTWNAKGAYDHKKDNAASTDDIDWTGAADPANNMYAYNAATTVYIPFVKSGNSEQAQPRARLESAYSRVGIVPSVVSVRKTWNDGESVNGQYMENRDGLRPDSVTVHLKGRTSDPDSPKIDRDLTLTAEGGWKGVFLNAPDTDSNGNAYTYTVTEDPVPGYTTGVYREAGRSWEIVNTHKKETFTLTGEKLWLNPDGTPAEPTVSNIWIAYRRITSTGPENGTRQIQVTPDSTGRWIYAFKDLDRYEPGGFEYQYVLEEHSVPEGWFAQTEAVPAGVTVTAEYDPEDLTTFRNFRKPDFGYAMIYCKVDNRSKAKDGNMAVPSFTFTVDMKKDGATVGGEYEYVLYDKAPQSSWSTALPEGTAQIGSGTIRSGDTVTVQPEQTVEIIGIPSGTECTVKEGMGAGWTSDRDYADDTSRMTIEQGRTSSVGFWNYYAARTTLTITGTKRLRGREQKAKEFAFNLSDYNKFDDTGDENSGYGQVIATVKTGVSRGTVTEDDGTKTGLAMFTFRATYDGNSTYTMREYGGTKVLHYRAEEALPTGAQVNGDGSVMYNNVTYDTARKDVTVTLTDNMDGTLKVTSTPLVFTNTYRPQKNIALTAHKELVGRTLQPDEFSFEVRRSGAAAGSAPIARGKNDADGNITFTPEITLTERDLAAISAETGIGEVKFLISEVQGTDPTVAYMTTPAEAVVQIGLAADCEVLTALPGQTLKHREADCETCGGSGEVGGLTAVLLQASSSNTGLERVGTIRLADSFSSQYMDICSDCGGTGYNSSGAPCGKCSGNGIFLKTENGMKTLHTPDGKVFLAVFDNMPLEAVIDMIRMDATQFPSASYWGLLTYMFTEEQWTAANGDADVLESMLDTVAILYLAEGDGECATCHGTGKVDGELYVDGEAEPVALVNHLKVGIQFTAEKLMDGQPAAEPFEFVLLETDETRRTETEIARTKNGMDGKILFENVYVDPIPAGDRYYVIREAEGTNPAVEYDTGEDLYKVTVISSPDGIHTVEQKLMSGDGVFRNTRKAGSLAIEIKTKGYTRPWWALNWEPPKFKVNVLLKDREGRPLAGYPLPGTKEKVRLSAKAGDMTTVSDVLVRAESIEQNVTDSDGRGTILIEGGSTAVITGLPDGATYEVSQPEDSMPKGYSQGSAEGTTGTIRTGQESKATFENNYQGEEEPPAPTTEQPKPSAEPTPSDKPVDGPTVNPTDEPTVKPTGEPTTKPTESPKAGPTATPAPTNTPKPQEVPKTGDTDNPIVWVGLILVGLIGIGSLTLGKFRKKK